MIPSSNQKYMFNPTKIAVKSDFTHNVDRLTSLGISRKNIIDIYIESQKYARGVRSMETPMRYIEFCEAQNTPPDIRFRELERIYKEVVQNWSKLMPPDYISQYETYVEQKLNNTGIENGIVSQIFFRFTTADNRTLVIDPSPSFMEQQHHYTKHLTYTFTDSRYFEIYLHSEEKSNIVEFGQLDTRAFDRVLYFARDSAPDQIQQVLENVKEALVEQKSTNIYVLMPTVYLEKRHSNGDLWNYLIQNYTIFKTVLMDQRAVNAKRKKQCLLILQNVPTKNCKEILVQKTKFVDKGTIEASEFRRIPYDSFTDRDRTLSEMYNTDYTDYSQINRRKKPIEYKYSSEISIWVSLTQKDGKYRPYYSIYDFPTADQIRKNTLPRGKAIKTRIPGKWYDTKEDAIASAEFVFQNNDFTQNVRKAVIKQYIDNGTPVSLKTFLFAHHEQIIETKGFSPDIYNDVFFRPRSASDPICTLMPGVDDMHKIEAVLTAYIKENKFSETISDLFVKQLVLLFDLTVIRKYYSHNPVRTIFNNRNIVPKQTAKLREAMASRSFSSTQEAAFLDLLLCDDKNWEKAMATLVRYYTGIPLNQLCALTRSDYIIDPDRDLAIISVTKEFQYRTLNVVPLPERKQRLLPIVRPIADMITATIESQGARSKDAPLFTKPGNRKDPLTPRQLRDYYNRIADQLGIPEIKLSVDVEHSSQTTTNISEYNGDFLRCNFDFHTRNDTNLEAEAINYLMARKLETTEGQFYCDYFAALMLLQMRLQIDQWAARYFAPDPILGMKYILPQRTTLSYVIPPANRHIRTRIELNIDPSDSAGEMQIILNVFARYGAILSMSFYPQEEEENNG